jgi:sugar phosphate isomerase/epimerase
MAGLRLTYCGNVHAAPDLATAERMLRTHSAPVAAAARARGREFGLGAWWPMELAAQLAGDPGAREQFAALLRELDLPLWTLNVFPFGDFHDRVVKTAVYRPDWSSEERLHYTRTCAEVACALVPRGSVVPLSTLPLGYRGPGDAPPDLRLMARNLARCASAFAALEQKTGVCCVLALEPEPDCLLETVAATAAFLEQWLFDEGAWTTVPEDVLRRHLGVCVDLCHLAVVGEEPLAALADLRARGIAVPKIQVSSCLEVRSAAGLDRLLSFDEPRYLHQTVAQNGVRALDLAAVAANRAEFAAAGRVRAHYHVPLYWDEAGAFGSTRAEVERVLKALARSPEPLPLLEVETYTWGVLPGFTGGEPLATLLARELDWAASCLGS